MALHAAGADVHRHRGPLGYRAQRRLEPVVPQHRGVDALREGAEVLQGPLRLDTKLAGCLGGGRIVLELVRGQLKPDARR